MYRAGDTRDKRVYGDIGKAQQRMRAGSIPAVPQIYSCGREVARIKKHSQSRVLLLWRKHEKQDIQISALDAQRKNGKTIFGAGLLLSDRAAAEHAAAECVATERAVAERDAAHKWMLSDRERDIIASLG